ncbi:MAG TPA: Smr/MutS family protein, partial [Geobacteraceae bacterium]|nr:Smr/MutS family protein [Geobacteraceae bacterium]
EEQQFFLQALQQLKLDVTFRDELPEEAPPVPRSSNRLRQLRRGTIRIDYELDLHGLTRDEAIEALEAFIGGAYRRGQQAVLVITGKGNNSTGEPVLLRAVMAWLAKEGKEMVSETVMAPKEMGGDGAVVAFIRTN